MIEKRALSHKQPKEIFENIYKHDQWNKNNPSDSASGQGSALKETQTLLQKLPNLFKQYNIKTIIDLPCGDYNWMQHLEYDFDHYEGNDIVADIIRENNIKFGNDNTVFTQKDCLQEQISDADLIMCRDLLIHFSNKDVFQFFLNLKKSNIRYILTTHFLDEKNSDIATGQWRAINLESKPFNFPSPLDVITEETKMYNGKYAQSKTMALWELKTIFQTLENKSDQEVYKAG